MFNNLLKFEDAIVNLEEVLKIEKSEIVRDSAIKRFEICFDLAWKSIKIYAKGQGSECFSPRGCFKTAVQLKLIDNDSSWVRMIEDRNVSAHVYSEKMADEVYSRLNEYLILFKNLKEKL
ncbi:MAG: HI0074 family nucleotidyltransferase substrate-binding subunit [Candidatus Pacebacteria bacterium]|nr:HI0074 family nucleotidyltransferase substrate-binding subunit [Candidatus Paceibacterota bacterium]